MIAYLFGDDTFTGRNIINQRALSSRAQVRWVDREEAEKTPLEHFMDAGKGSLLGNVIVVMRNPSSYSEEIRDALLEACSSSYAGNVILWDTEFDARTSFHKRMKRLKESEGVYQPKDENGMVHWALRYAEEQGEDFGKIEPQVIRAVVRKVGFDVWATVQELHKIAMLPPETLSSEVDNAVPDRDNGFESAFPLLQAIVSKQRHAALSILQNMLVSGASEEFILAMLSYQFRLFLAIRMGKDGGESFSAVHQKTKLHPTAIAKAAPFASRLSVSAIGEALARIAAAEKSLHTKSMDGQSIITMLIIGLTR